MTNILNEVEIKLLSNDATVPTRSYATDSGLDLYSAEDVEIKAGVTTVIKTDIAVNIPVGYEAEVRPRSGVTSKTKLRVQLGTVDQSYDGNVGVIVDNISQDVANGTIAIQKGDKIAQLIIGPVETPKVKVVNEFSDIKERGSNGFGSTGYSTEDAPVQPKEKAEQEETIVITRREYDSLVEDSEWLGWLEVAGIDNTSAYEHAIEMRREGGLPTWII